MLLLLVVAIYTITSMNDKYAVSKAKYNGAQLTFLMAAGTAFFLLFLLPFSDTRFTLHPMSFVSIGLIALCKYLEFALSARILITMSVFELKAWLGIPMFMSYFTDVMLYGDSLSVPRLVFIALTAGGLVIIASEGKQQVNYKEIFVPLVFYLLAKFAYGYVIKESEAYLSSTMTLFFALILLAVVLIPAAKPWRIAAESPEGKKGLFIVLGCKLPNAFGLLGENALAAQSLVTYSFISPMILVSVFIIDFFTRKGKLPLTLMIGGIAVMAGIFGFQAAE